MSKSSNMIITHHMTWDEIRPGADRMRMANHGAMLVGKQVLP